MEKCCVDTFAAVSCKVLYSFTHLHILHKFYIHHIVFFLNSKFIKLFYMSAYL